MKLLFDQNLSFKMVPTLEPLFPDSRHLEDFNLARYDRGAARSKEGRSKKKL